MLQRMTRLELGVYIGMVQRGNAHGHWYMMIHMVNAVLNPTISEFP